MKDNVNQKNNFEYLLLNKFLIDIEKKDKEWLLSIFKRFNGYPNLNQLWSLMDDVWNEFECNSEVMDHRITKFYSHPVWLLNGLFIEQDKESLDYRNQFVNFIKKINPKRIADFGGGYGGLARMIGEDCKNSEVEVIEAYPHPAAIALAEKTPNVRYEKALSGKYDFLIATDLFEHVPDPLSLVFEAAKHLRKDGKFLIANCFEPVILCHLPQTFHFRHSWSFVMESLGFSAGEKVAYGQVFSKSNKINTQSARALEKQSKKLFNLTGRLPGRFARILTKYILSF